MNKKMLTARTAALLTTALLSVGGLASAASAYTSTSLDAGTYDVIVGTASTSGSGSLNTDASWQTIQIPLADIGGTFPSNLSIATAGLPDGLSISLQRATQVGNTVVLNVDVNRSNGNAVANGLADVTLLSGGTALTTFQVPVSNLTAIDTN
ncbi:hypothetical protein [Deinococcus sp. UYEF24]